MKLRKWQIMTIGAIIALGVIALTVCLIVFLVVDKDDDDETKGAIIANGFECAGIGRDIMKAGGSAVDVAISVGLCEGLGMPHSTGVGGGFLMMIYTNSTGIVETLNARETAPAAATADMFDEDANLSVQGGLAVAVPGELKGYKEAHDKYGVLPWEKLFEPIIELCRKGNYVTPYLESVFEMRKNYLKGEESLREIFVDPATGEPYKAGDRVKRLKLADTLELVAKKGIDVLYDGELTEQFVQDIQDFNGIITKEDLKNYKPRWSEPYKTNLIGGRTMYNIPLPGSGLVLEHILNLVHERITKDRSEAVNWQRIVESFKFAYGKRTSLGDPFFVEGIEEIITEMRSQAYLDGVRSKMSDSSTEQDPEYYGAKFSNTDDHGTAHWAVLHPNGDAVSITGTINLHFGAKIASRSTGIILNDEMDDFAANRPNDQGLVPSPANFIEPGKRPMSSMCPTIILDSDGIVRMVVGAAGGSRITTSVALIIIRHLYFEQSINDSIQGDRLHHQLLPMSISFEPEFDKGIVKFLTDIGHQATFDPASDGGFAAAVGIVNLNGKISASWDKRRDGSVAFLK